VPPSAVTPGAPSGSAYLASLSKTRCHSTATAVGSKGRGLAARWAVPWRPWLAGGDGCHAGLRTALGARGCGVDTRNRCTERTVVVLMINRLLALGVLVAAVACSPTRSGATSAGAASAHGATCTDAICSVLPPDTLRSRAGKRECLTHCAQSVLP
jgi:hypothetical protein